MDGIGRVVAPAFCPMMTEPKNGSKRERYLKSDDTDESIRGFRGTSKNIKLLDRGMLIDTMIPHHHQSHVTADDEEEEAACSVTSVRWL